MCQGKLSLKEEHIEEDFYFVHSVNFHTLLSDHPKIISFAMNNEN